MVSFICGIFKKENKKRQLIKLRNRVKNWLPGTGYGGGREKLVKGFKLSFIK